MGKVVNMRRTPPEDPHQKIEESLVEHEEEKTTRESFTPKRRPWDPQWGGPCPYENIPDPVSEPKEKFKPALIDRAAPYILIFGFFAFIFITAILCYLALGVHD